jgi:Xaa-Pro aminopeptidase
MPSAYLIRSEARQDPDFWYLTGVDSRYAMLVIVPTEESARDVLFLPELHQFAGAQLPIDDPRFREAAWNRPEGRLAAGPDAERVTGVGETYPVDQALDRMRDLLSGIDTVYFPIDDETLYAPRGLRPPRSMRQQMRDALAQAMPNTVFRDVTPLLRRMRLVKDRYEVAALRRAADISARSFVTAMQQTRAGLNDLAIAGVMEAFWKGEGAPRAAFAPIVSSGPGSLLLYTLRAERYDYADRVMRDGELLYIDYGAAEVDMYASDVCRTFPVSGRFTAEQRRLYQMVLEAQEAALAEIRPGVMMKQVIRAAAEVFRRHGLEQYEDIERMGAERVWGVMPSPTYWLARNGDLTRYSGARGTGVRDLGHHIGLDALDSRDYSVPLQPGMVFTVEPKLYVPALGMAIMIEDMILVTEDGYENLSAAAPKTVEEIERTMNGTDH